MVKKEILITYKRRRFSKDSKLADKVAEISKDNKRCNDIAKPNSICLFPSDEINDPEMMVTSDKTAEYSKEKYKFPLITFSRRAKRKRGETEKIADLSTIIEHNQCGQESASELCSLSEQSQLFDHDEVAVVGKKSEIKPISSEQATEQARLNETFVSSHTSNEDPSNIPTRISVSNMEKDHACACNMDSSKFLINANPKNFMESQSSSTPNPQIVLNENIDGARKELDWLEDMDRILQERKEKVDFCSLIKQSDINCKEGQSPGFNNYVIPLQDRGQSSGSNSHVIPLQEQGHSSEFDSHVIPLREQSLLTKLDIPLLEKQSHEEASSISSHYRNFLGPISDNRYKTHQISTERPIYHRQRHINDYNLIGNIRLKESNCFTNNMLGMYSNEWSEEELDYLWIGIRRHGINNWNAILHDPKLHFLSSRVPEDLAMQWKIEHRKFLNQDAGYSSIPILDNAAASSRSKAINQCTVETKLSLGDVYHRRRNMFSSYRNDNSRYLQMPMRTQNATYNQTYEKIMHDYNYIGSFPHLLNETPTSMSSQTRDNMNLLNSEVGFGMHFPYAEAASSSKKARRREFMNRKSRGLFRDTNNVGVKVNEASASPNEPWKVKASKTYPVDISMLENNRISMQGMKYKGAAEPKGLVIIESGATSEDTISE